MAKPGGIDDIEDVVSSVRRLVSPEARPRPLSRDIGLDMLVLTPALRVVADDQPKGPLVLTERTADPTPAALPDTAPDSGAPEPDHPVADDIALSSIDADEAPMLVIEGEWEDAFWSEPEPVLAELALEAEEAEIVIADTPDPKQADPAPWAQTDAGWYDPEPESFLSPEPAAEFVAEPVPEPVAEFVAEPVPEPVAEFVEEPVPEPVAEFVAEPVPEPIVEFVEEPVPEPVAEIVAEPAPEPVAEFVQEPVPEPVAELVAEPVPEPVAEFEATSEEMSAATSLADSVAEPEAGPAAEAWLEPVPEVLPEPVSEASFDPVAEPVPEAALEPAPVPQAAAAEQLHAAPDAGFGLTDADGNPVTVMDESALQELVRALIRDELQGALGERITHNVRKLVRAEINRALTARALD